MVEPFARRRSAFFRGESLSGKLHPPVHCSVTFPPRAGEARIVGGGRVRRRDASRTRSPTFDVANRSRKENPWKQNDRRKKGRRGNDSGSIEPESLGLSRELVSLVLSLPPFYHTTARLRDIRVYAIISRVGTRSIVGVEGEEFYLAPQTCAGTASTLSPRIHRTRPRSRP